MEPRKASEVLLSLESKVDALLSIIKSQDLNIKILSNKLSVLMENLEQQDDVAPQKITVEAVNSTFNPNMDRDVFVSLEDRLPVEESPNGFRRTSRPETFSGDDMYLNKDKIVKFPVQLPKNMPQNQKVSEVIVPDKVEKKPAPPKQEPLKNQTSQNSIPVMQRVVDKNGKSIFLANVEIVDLSTGVQVYKTRTNGTGKWMASLAVGNYRISLNRKESLSKEKMEVAQDIQVDGSSSTLELSTLIIK